MTTQTETPKATRVTRLIGSHIIAEFPHAGRWVRYGSPGYAERMAKALEEACKDFMSHCRDHRSLDVIELTVMRETQDQCSACGAEWEVDGTTCASCGAEVDA